MGEPWSVADFWRSYLAALAIEHGDDPEAAVENHRRWCVMMGLEQAAPAE